MITDDLRHENIDAESINAEIINEAENGKNEGTNAIATIETSLKDVLKGAEGNLIIIEDIEATTEKLEALVEKYNPDIDTLVALERLDSEQLKKAKDIRAIFRESRLGVQKIQKHNTSVLNTAKTSQKDRLEPLVKIVSPVEDRIDLAIKAEEKKKEDEKAEKDRLEKIRVDAINKKIMDAGIEFERMLIIFKTPEELDLFDSKTQEFEDDLESLAEMEFEGAELLERVRARRHEISDRVDEAKKLEDQKGEVEQKSTELSEKEKELNERAKQLEESEKLLERSKARMKYLTSELGLAFDGTEFRKNDLVISYESVQSDDENTYVEKVEAIETTIKRENKIKELGLYLNNDIFDFDYEGEVYRFPVTDKNFMDLDKQEFDSFYQDLKSRVEKYKTEKKEKAENKKDFDALLKDYEDTTGEKYTDIPEEITKQDVETLDKKIKDFVIKRDSEAERLRLENLKKAGEPIFNIITNRMDDMFKKVNPNKINNADAKEITSKFLDNIAALIQKLESDLQQKEVSE